MLYDLSNEIEWKKLQARAHALREKGKQGKRAIVDLTEKKPPRSLKQNSYLHVCITLFAIEFGYTLMEAKTLLKRRCEFMRYEKNGEVFLKETSKMDSGELTPFIEWIRNTAAKQGCYIPSSEEYLQDKYKIDKEIESHKIYLS